MPNTSNSVPIPPCEQQTIVAVVSSESIIIVVLVSMMAGSCMVYVVFCAVELVFHRPVPFSMPSPYLPFANLGFSQSRNVRKALSDGWATLHCSAAREKFPFRATAKTYRSWRLSIDNADGSDRKKLFQQCLWFWFSNLI